jgi:hypothetical protein
MNVELKTPVDILQELIVMHTTRVEFSNKMLGKIIDESLKTTFHKIIQQSSLFIEALMNELSNFGDAVKADANRNNEYNNIYTNVLVDFDAADITKLQYSFDKMEELLKNNYVDIIDANKELSTSMGQILNAQLKSFY